MANYMEYRQKTLAQARAEKRHIADLDNRGVMADGVVEPIEPCKRCGGSMTRIWHRHYAHSRPYTSEDDWNAGGSWHTNHMLENCVEILAARISALELVDVNVTNYGYENRIGG